MISDSRAFFTSIFIVAFGNRAEEKCFSTFWNMAVLQNLPDSELVDLLLANDEKAIVYFFYKKFYRVFEYHIYRMFTYRVDVQEFVHEFFLYLYQDNWKRLRSYNSEQSQLSTWVSAVSSHFFLFYKKTKIDSNAIIPINGQWDEKVTSYKQECKEQVIMDVTKAIDSLKNDTERELVRQMLIEGMDYDEVAKLHNLSVDYAYTVKSRAVARLRNILKDYRA